MSYATIDDLRSQLGVAKTPEQSAAYVAKMLHDLPPSKTVERAKFIVQRCTGRRVLEFGASGPLHDAIVKVAATVIGVDREDGPGVVGFDLDDVTRAELPHMDAPDLIICGEVIEHLGNPQWFLARLRRQYAGVPIIVSVPNGFSAIAQKWIAKGKENVNRDHVAWYSPMTLATLLARAGYTTADLSYYNGDGPTAEGLLVVTE